MSLDVELALRELLGMKEREFNSYFVVGENEKEIVVAIRKNSKGQPVWLERGTWLCVRNYVKDKGGSWDKNRHEWTIPITLR